MAATVKSTRTYSQVVQTQPRPKVPTVSTLTRVTTLVFLGIYIFIDYENLWISVKQAAAKIKNMLTNEDHRVYLDIGKLISVIANGRPVASCCLYASELPKLDKFWQKIKGQGCIWDIRKRSTWTGMQKEVDTAMSVDIVDAACSKPPGTIGVVSGDADFIPCIEKAVKQGRKVEVLSWEQALASGVKNLSGNIEIRYLNKFLNDITFVSREFDSKHEFVPNIKAVVLHMKPGVFLNNVPSEKWCQDLEKISRWPFQYYWHETKTDDLVLVFKNFKSKKESFTFYVHRFMAEIKDHPLEGVASAEIYENGGQTDAKKRCGHRFCCKFGVRCWSEHTKKEMESFRKNKGVGHSYEKTKPCWYYDQGRCDKGDRCYFAHGSKDAFCPQCGKSGHFEKSCSH